MQTNSSSTIQSLNRTFGVDTIRNLRRRTSPCNYQIWSRYLHVFWYTWCNNSRTLWRFINLHLWPQTWSFQNYVENGVGVFENNVKGSPSLRRKKKLIYIYLPLRKQNDRIFEIKVAIYTNITYITSKNSNRLLHLLHCNIKI